MIDGNGQKSGVGGVTGARTARLPRLRGDLDLMPSPVAEQPGLLLRDPFRYTEENRPQAPIGRIAYRFLWENPASNFYSGGPAIPGGTGHIPVAQDAVAK